MRGRDHQGLTNMAEDIDTRLSEEQKAAVRRLVAANACDKRGRQRVFKTNMAELVADAEELMFVLGVHPSQVDDPDFHVGPSRMVTARS